MKLDPHPAPRTKINSKWIKDLNRSPETVRLPEENTGEKLLDVGLGNAFLDVTAKVQTAIGKTDKSLPPTKKLLAPAPHPGDMIHKMKRQPAEREKICANRISDIQNI